MNRMKKTLSAVVVAMCLGLILGALPVQASPFTGKSSVQTPGDKGAQPAAQKSPKAPKAGKKAPPQGKVNLNTATVEQLQTLPRVGAAMAKRIVDYRTANKGFKTLEELRNVKGIGPKVFESLRPYLTL